MKLSEGARAIATYPPTLTRVPGPPEAHPEGTRGKCGRIYSPFSVSRARTGERIREGGLGLGPTIL